MKEFPEIALKIEYLKINDSLLDLAVSYSEHPQISWYLAKASRGYAPQASKFKSAWERLNRMNSTLVFSDI